MSRTVLEFSLQQSRGTAGNSYCCTGSVQLKEVHGVPCMISYKKTAACNWKPWKQEPALCIPHPPWMPQSDVPPHGMHAWGRKCRRRVLRQARALNQATDTLLKFILNCAATSSFLRVLPYAMHACRLQLWRAISFVLSRTHNHECRNIGSKCVCSLCCISSQAVKGTLPSLDSSNDPQTGYIAEHMRNKSSFLHFFCP